MAKRPANNRPPLPAPALVTAGARTRKPGGLADMMEKFSDSLDRNTKAVEELTTAQQRTQATPPKPATAAAQTAVAQAQTAAMPPSTAAMTETTAAQQRITERFSRVAETLADAVEKSFGETLAEGATHAVGSIAAQKAVSKIAPSMLGSAANAARGAPMPLAAINAPGVFTSAAAAAPSAMATAAPAIAATGTAAASATPAVAGFGAALAAAALPLTVLAAVVGSVYVAFFKWDEVPLLIKPILLAVSPLILAIRTLALGVNTALLPFRALGLACDIATGGIRLLTRAALAAPGVLVSAFTTASSYAISAAKTTVSALTAIAGTLIALPQRALQGIGGLLTNTGTAVQGAVARVTNTLRDAAAKYAAYGEALTAIGTQYRLSAAAAATYQLASERTGMAVGDLVAAMPEGSAAFQAWAQEMRRLGLQMGSGTAAALQFADAQRRLSAAGSGFWQTLGAALAPALERTLSLFTGAVRIATQWVAANQPLITSAMKIASAVGIAAAGIAGLGTALTTAGTVLSPLVVALGAVAAGLTVVRYRTEAGRNLWATYSGSLATVWTAAQTYLGQTWRWSSTVFAGIADAVRAGNLPLAIETTMAAAKVAWATGLQELDAITRGTLGGILQPLAAGDWAAAGQGAMNALKMAWLVGVEELRTAWDGIRDSVDETEGWLRKAWEVGLQQAAAAVLRFVDALPSGWEKVKEGFFAAADAIKPYWDQTLSYLAGKLAAFVAASLDHVKPLAGFFGVLGIGSTEIVDSLAHSKLQEIANAKPIATPGSGPAGEPTTVRSALEKVAAGQDTASKTAAIDAETDARIRARDEARAERRKKLETEIAALRQANEAIAARTGAEADRQREENARRLADLIKQANAEGEAAKFTPPKIPKPAPGLVAQSAPIGTFASQRIEAVLGIQPDAQKQAVADTREAARSLNVSSKAIEAAAKLLDDAARNYQFAFGPQ